MSSRTRSRSAYESALNGGITAGATNFNVDSATGVTHPCYLVIDPDDGAKREYVLVGNISGTAFSSVTRGLDGSAAGAVAHDSGAPIRAVWTHLHLDDIFDDIEAAESTLTTVTGDISALEAADTAIQGDIAALEAADTAHFGGTDTADHPEVTTSVRGFMSAADKTKLDALDLTDITDLQADIFDLFAIGTATDTTTDATVPTVSTFESGASVTFNPPAGWGTYDLMATGLVVYRFSRPGSAGYTWVAHTRVIIAGNAGTEVQVSQHTNAGTDIQSWNDPMAMATHSRTGLSGSSTVAVQYAKSAGTTGSILKAYSTISYWAVRTS